MLFKTSDGINLSYSDTEDNRQPIIFLSGYSGRKEEWNLQKNYFKSSYRIITLDHRNHGDSTVTQKGLRISRLGQDLFELINSLKLKKVILVGHSMGMAVIWAYLSLHGEDKVERIVDVDESPKTLNDSSWKYGALDFTWENLILKDRNIERTKMTKNHINDDFFNLLKSKNIKKPFDGTITETLLRNHLVQDWRDILSSTKIPQLIIGSKYSPIWSSKFVEECMKLISNESDSEYFIFQNSGHLPHMEEPELFNELLEKFLNK